MTETQVIETVAGVGSPLVQYGGAAGALLAFVLMFAWVLSRFKRDNSANNAEAVLYTNLSNQITQLVNRISQLEAVKDAQANEISTLKGKISRLETVEAENAHLRDKIADKDDKLAEKDTLLERRTQENERLSNALLALQERMHDLERRLSSDELKCQLCVHKTGAGYAGETAGEGHAGHQS